MLKTYKYRIDPNKKESLLIEKHFGCNCLVFNWALGLQKHNYAIFRRSLTRATIQHQLVKKKKSAKFIWHNEVNNQSLLNTLLNIHPAGNNFFKGYAQFLRFKSKKKRQRSYQYPQYCTANFDQGVIGIKTPFSRQFVGKIKIVTISQTTDIHYLLKLSDDTKIDSSKYLAKASLGSTAQQEIYSRQQKESKNYQKQKLVVTRVYERVHNARLDLHHKITHRLVYKNQTTSYALENLGIKNIVKNHKLTKVIYDIGWGQLIALFTYKAHWYGQNILKVNRIFARKFCTHCHHKLESLPLSVRRWTCLNCHTAYNRDLNAANNIRQQALADVAGLASV